MGGGGGGGARGLGGGGGVGWGGQGGCERRIKVFVKIKKQKNWGRGGRVGLGGVRVDVNEELKFLRKFQKKYFFGGGGGVRGGGGGVGVGLGGGGQGGCE